MQCVRRLRLRPVLQYRRMGADVSSGALDAPLTTRSGTRKRGALSRCDAEGSVLFVCDLQERFQSIIHEFETVTKTARMLIEAARALKIPIVVTEQVWKDAGWLFSSDADDVFALQYPERLGPTVQELSDALSHPVSSWLNFGSWADQHLHEGLSSSRWKLHGNEVRIRFPFAPDEDIKIIPKTRFSMMVEDNNYPSEDRQTVILCGIEAHVCVLQTALDLLFDGHTVFIVKDGTTSLRKVFRPLQNPEASRLQRFPGVSSSRQNDRVTAINRLENAGAVITTAEVRHPGFAELCFLVRKPHRSGTHPSRAFFST
eukprot:scaffold1108_cov260-Pinguiococcus_pyrenoidosus.AAC.8